MRKEGPGSLAPPAPACGSQLQHALPPGIDPGPCIGSAFQPDLLAPPSPRDKIVANMGAVNAVQRSLDSQQGQWVEGTACRRTLEWTSANIGSVLEDTEREEPIVSPGHCSVSGMSCAETSSLLKKWDQIRKGLCVVLSILSTPQFKSISSLVLSFL